MESFRVIKIGTFQLGFYSLRFLVRWSQWLSTEVLLRKEKRVNQKLILTLTARIIYWSLQKPEEESKYNEVDGSPMDGESEKSLSREVMDLAIDDVPKFRLPRLTKRRIRITNEKIRLGKIVMAAGRYCTAQNAGSIHSLIASKLQKKHKESPVNSPIVWFRRIL